MSYKISHHITYHISHITSHHINLGKGTEKTHSG